MLLRALDHANDLLAAFGLCYRNVANDFSNLSRGFRFVLSLITLAVSFLLC